MDKIICPGCGAEINMDSENCPSCGAPVSAVTGQAVSGTPIDNKEAIDSMLEKANLLVEEGRTLGIEGLENENEKDDGQQLNGYGEEAAFFGEQNGANNQQNFTDESLIVENAPGVTLFEMDENGNVIPEKKPEPAAEPTKKKKQRQKRERNVNINDDNREREEKDKKKKKTSKRVVLAAAVICLAIGIAAGFFGKMLLFPDFSAPSCQSFAEKAVKAVNSVLDSDEEIYVAESYVKEFTSSTQCLIRTFAVKSDTVSEKWYRVKVDSSESKKIKVYTQYDEETLNEMFNSSNDEERARAAVLSGIQEETDRLINDMRGGNGWTEANPILLNSSIHPYQLPSEKND